MSVRPTEEETLETAGSGVIHESLDDCFLRPETRKFRQTNE